MMKGTFGILGIAVVTMVAAACGKIYEKQPAAPAAGANPGTPPSEMANVTENAVRPKTSPPSSPGCSIDTLNGARATDHMTAEGDKPVTLAGWAADKTGNEVPSTVVVVFESGVTSYSAGARTGLTRHDVARAFGNPRLDASGYEVTADLSSLPAGTYRFVILITDSNGIKRCDVPRTLTLQRR